MVLGFWVLVSGEALVPGAFAQDSAVSTAPASGTSAHSFSTGYSSPSTGVAAKLPTDSASEPVSGSPVQKDDFSESDFDNSLGMPLLKHLASDQFTIWTSPFHLRWDDAAWLFPFAEGTAGLIATDRATSRALGEHAFPAARISQLLELRAGVLRSGRSWFLFHGRDFARRSQERNGLSRRRSHGGHLRRRFRARIFVRKESSVSGRRARAVLSGRDFISIRPRGAFVGGGERVRARISRTAHAAFRIRGLPQP